MNPPLREAADREAIRQALKDGTIDVIASDHAPHGYDAKEREFDEAPNGILGLETALGLAISELVDTGVLTLPQLMSRMSTMPARIFGLQGGSLVDRGAGGRRRLRPGRPVDGGPGRIPLQEPQHAVRRQDADRAGRADHRQRPDRLRVAGRPPEAFFPVAQPALVSN